VEIMNKNTKLGIIIVKLQFLVASLYRLN